MSENEPKAPEIVQAEVVETLPATQPITPPSVGQQREKKRLKSFPNTVLTHAVTNKITSYLRKGMKRSEVAKMLGITPSAIFMKEKREPVIKLTWKRAERLAADIAERSLWRRANGLKVREQVLDRGGELVERWKELPPDPTAAQIYLRAHRPELYKDSQEDAKPSQAINIVTVSGKTITLKR